MKDFKRLLKDYMAPHKLKIILSVVMTILNTVSRSSQPFIIGMLLSELSLSVLNGVAINMEYISLIIILLGLSAVGDAVGEYLSQYFLTDVVQDTMHTVRTDIYSKINKLPISYFDTHQQGDILNRITSDVDTISNALQQSFLRVIASSLMIFFSVVFMFILSPFFAIVALLILPICIIIYRRFLKKSQPTFQQLQSVLGNLSGYVQEYFTGFAVVKLFGQEEQVIDGFTEITDELNDVSFKANFMSSTINPILGHVAHLFYIILFLLLGLLVLDGPLMIGGFVLAAQMDIGGIQAFIQYVWQITGPIGDVTQLSGVIQAAFASLRRVYELLDETEEVKESVAYDIDLKDIKGDVALNNVKFGYPNNPLLMDGINVSIKSGDTVAIVGPTGAGKTTLINLLMRFYDVTDGSITVDGIDIRDFTREQLRTMFGMVLQDPWLYYGTIADNIRFGKLDATDAEVVSAAKVANVNHFIRTLPDGYQSMLNKESSNVSQGQKQLLTIARALIGEPKIVILDEATSSVDTRLEMLIQKAMEKAMENRTSFIIAHRLSTIRDADLILVMDHGSIVEQGTHESLLEQDGMYRQLYESQFSEDE